MINHRTLFTTASGRKINLLAPEASQIDFADVAEHLAKLARYYGSTPGRVYSVAEHCVIGARSASQRGQGATAAYFLLHDAHEFIRGDEATPKKNADAAAARELFGDYGVQVIEQVRQLGEWRLDRAIHQAAGLPFPLPGGIRRAVKRLDLIMRETEWRDLVPTPAPWPRDPLIKPFSSSVHCWPWQRARDEFLITLDQLLPGARGSRGGDA